MVSFCNSTCLRALGFIFWMGIVAVSAIPVPSSGGSPPPTPPSLKVKDPLEYFLLEELPADLMIGNAAVDARLRDTYDATTLAQLTYSFIPGVDERQDLFAVDPNTAIIKTTQRIDRDALCPGSHACYVLLHIQVHPVSLGKVIRILVEILDVNDHQPEFPSQHDQSGVELSILESAVVGSHFILPPAMDADSGRNGIQGYELLSSTEKFELQVIKEKQENDSPVELQLVLKEPLDRETTEFYQLRIVARDSGDPAQSGTMTVNITVEDINDNEPKFTNTTYEVFIDEHLPPGSSVYQVLALDRDHGDNGRIKYGFTKETQETHGDLFGIFESSGQIYLKTELDFEYGSTYLLRVTASDQGSSDGGESLTQPGHATVIVRVKDDNDNPPKITLNTLSNSGVAQVSEGSAPGDRVAQITMADQDGGDNGKIECTLTHEKFALAKIHQSQYDIVTTQVLDREIKPFYDLTVVCRDLGSTPNVATQQINIRVVDINDESPEFSQKNYSTHIKHSNRINDVLIQVQAEDRDEGENGQIRFSLQPDARNWFQIDSESGVITVDTVLTPDSPRVITFHVVATDLGTPSRSSSATVIVSILDPHEEIPIFTQRSYEFGIFENKPAGSKVGSVMLSGQQQQHPNDHFYFPTDNTEDAQFFTIDSSSGKIYTKITLDRERQSVYYMKVLATSRGLPAETGSVSVTIYVADQNDNPPIIAFPSARNHTIQISGSLPEGYDIVPIQASDRDIGDNGKLTYYIVDGNTDDTFQIQATTGLISTHRDLSRVAQTIFRLRILVQDNGYPKLNAEAPLDVIINSTLTHYAVTSREEVISSRHATMIISITASVLVFIFVVLFLVMIFLVYRRAKTVNSLPSSSSASTKNNNLSENNCNYSSVTSTRTLSSCFDGVGVAPGEEGVRDRPEGQEAADHLHYLQRQQLHHHSGTTAPQEPVPGKNAELMVNHDNPGPRFRKESHLVTCYPEMQHNTKKFRRKPDVIDISSGTHPQHQHQIPDSYDVVQQHQGPSSPPLHNKHHYHHSPGYSPRYQENHPDRVAMEESPSSTDSGFRSSVAESEELSCHSFSAA